MNVIHEVDDETLDETDDMQDMRSVPKFVQMFDDMILHDAYEGKLTTIVTFETYYMPSPQCMAALVFTLRHHDYTVPAAIHRQASMFQWVTTVGIDFS